MLEFEIMYNTYQPGRKRPDGFFNVVDGRDIESARRKTERFLDSLKTHGEIARYSFDRSGTRQLPGAPEDAWKYVQGH